METAGGTFDGAGAGASFGLGGLGLFASLGLVTQGGVIYIYIYIFKHLFPFMWI